jgi:hypothetical protein
MGTLDILDEIGTRVMYPGLAPPSGCKDLLFCFDYINRCVYKSPEARVQLWRDECA